MKPVLRKEICAIIVVTFAGWSLTGSADADTLPNGMKSNIISSNQDKYEIHIELPELPKESVPAGEIINAALKRVVLESGCDREEAKASSIGFYHEAWGEAVAVNPAYVSFEIRYSVFCGGAHPSHGLYYELFDSQTGERVRINHQIADQDFEREDFDYDQLEIYQRSLAKVFVQYADPNDETFRQCYEEGSEVGGEVAADFPTIKGLGPARTVFITTSPAHVNQVCQMSVAVPFSEVSGFFAAESVVHRWMK